MVAFAATMRTSRNAKVGNVGVVGLLGSLAVLGAFSACSGGGRAYDDGTMGSVAGSGGSGSGTPGRDEGGDLNSSQGGQDADAPGGTAGEASVGGGLGSGGLGGAAECDVGATRCSGNLLQSCGDDGLFGEPIACPASTPICHQDACIEPPSCSGLAATCGPLGNDSCCSSPVIDGGAFDRRNDLHYPAQITTFRLDEYEVTVGRFRSFVASRWVPPAGSGKHAHLNDGKGLKGGSEEVFETGWQEAWNDLLPPTTASWNGADALGCSEAYQTWTSAKGANESMPINCIDWEAGYAFCIWDGGFLPSATELNYAAAGGDEQRIYPWGAEVAGMNTALAVYGCYFGGAGTCSGIANIATSGSAGKGAGRWGQLDLSGSMFEWTADWSGSSSADCVDCATLTESTRHVFRGGSFASAASWLGTAGPGGVIQLPKRYEYGVRCARSL